MEEDDFISKNEGQDKVHPVIYLLSIIELAAVTSCVVILLQSSNDCENPVRTWILVTSSVLTFHCLFLALFYRPKGKTISISVAVNTVVFTFLFLWMLTGFVWIYYDDNCESDFDQGYYLVLSLFGVYFGVIALTIAFLCSVIVLTSVGALFIDHLIIQDQD